MKFQKGNKFAKGGPRPGAGPKPSWYKKRCESLLQEWRLLDFLGEVARGSTVDRIVKANGRVLKISSSIRDRITAIVELRDAAFGRPASSMDVTTRGKLLPSLPSMIEDARKRAGLSRVSK